MKKYIALLSLIPCFVFAADYTDGDVRKHDNTYINLNLFHAMNLPNPGGETYEDTYLEVEGGGRSGVLDFYFFADVNHILLQGRHDNNPGEFFVKIQPRLSIDGMTRSDLAFGPVKEWFVATMFKGGNGFERYYAGIGTDLKVPGFDLLNINFYAMSQHVEEDSLDFGGVTIAPNWYTVLHHFSENTYLTYQGWMEYSFGNAYAARESDVGTHVEFQMFNGFYTYFMKHYALSASIKFHRQIGFMDSNTSDETSYFLGMHYLF